MRGLQRVGAIALCFYLNLKAQSSCIRFHFPVDVMKESKKAAKVRKKGSDFILF